MAIEDIQNYLDKYAERITGITIDRGLGAGAEYFEIMDYDIDETDQTILIIQDWTDIVDAKFLETCDYVKFHLSDEVVVKEDENRTYTLEFTKKELTNIVRTLLQAHDRLIEVKNYPSILTDVSILPNKITNIYELLQARAKGV